MYTGFIPHTEHTEQNKVWVASVKYFTRSSKTETSRMLKVQGARRRFLPYLLERHQHLLSLAEVPEEQVEGPRNQRRVVMHGQVQKNPQKGPSSVVVQIQGCVLLTGKRGVEVTHSH